MVTLQVGDWVQAVADVTEQIGGFTHTHAKIGGIGHVLEVLEDGDVVNVFFERTGTTTICFPEELRSIHSPVESIAK